MTISAIFFRPTLSLSESIVSAKILINAAALFKIASVQQSLWKGWLKIDEFQWVFCLFKFNFISQSLQRISSSFIQGYHLHNFFSANRTVLRPRNYRFWAFWAQAQVIAWFDHHSGRLTETNNAFLALISTSINIFDLVDPSILLESFQYHFP